MENIAGKFFRCKDNPNVYQSSETGRALYNSVLEYEINRKAQLFRMLPEVSFDPNQLFKMPTFICDYCYLPINIIQVSYVCLKFQSESSIPWPSL